MESLAHSVRTKIKSLHCLTAQLFCHESICEIGRKKSIGHKVIAICLKIVVLSATFIQVLNSQPNLLMPSKPFIQVYAPIRPDKCASI